jgi:uncharacterized membrane protein YgcG
MNKITAVLISFIIIISMPMTAFASVPAKKGYVQDTANIFPKNKIDDIKVIAENSNLSFYILTIDTLNGQNSEQFAAEVFSSWELKDNDVLILISKNDQRIEVNYKNTTFLSNVTLPKDYDDDANPNETILEKLIRKHFIPYAKKEDFAAGVMDFMNTFRGLNPIKETNKGQPPKASSSPSKDEGNNDSSSSFLTTPLYIIGAILGITLISFAYPAVRRMFNDSDESTVVRRTEQNASQESTLATRSRSQRPTTVADAVENLLNNNNTPPPTPTPPVTSRRSNNDDSEANSGFRVIRADDEEENHDKIVDNPEAKRIIR